MSKLLERLILARIQLHTTFSCNINPFQYAYRRYFSIESSLLLAFDNTHNVIDEGSSTMLISLGLSAAFDANYHSILLNRLQICFGITGLALALFHSYLAGRRQFARIGDSRSPVTRCFTNVPQGCVLGPIMFTLYIAYCRYCQLFWPLTSTAC